MRCRRSAAVLLGTTAFLLSVSHGHSQNVASHPAFAPELLIGRTSDVGMGAEDRQLYASIFELQQAGRWAEADSLIRQVDNDLLLGHVQAQRYLHPTAYTSRYDELRDWLLSYPDLPQAAAIYRLAEKRRPAESEATPKPVPGYLAGSGQELAEDNRPTRQQGHHGLAAESATWVANVEKLVAGDALSEAASLVADPPAAAGDLESDLARWKLAKGYFANRDDKRAYAAADVAAQKSGQVEPRIHWTAGLAAWRADELDDAHRHFAALAASDAPLRMTTAGAYWAARVAARMGDREESVQFFEQAANAKDDFYGQLALERLGQSSPIGVDDTESSIDASALVRRHEGVQRAIALSNVGHDILAAKEIRKLAARARPGLTGELAALASALDLPAAQMRVAQRLHLQGQLVDPGWMYPIPTWQPPGGYLIDRALLFALIRAESGFEPGARSYANARGVMQILPATAELVVDDVSITYAGADALFDPVTNMAIGQAYVRDLFENRLVDGSLLHMVIAYNAGLTRLGDWLPRYADLSDDPLLLVESIPIPETRRHVKKVMSNLWVYRARLGQEQPSLKSLASDKWPEYRPLEKLVRYARAD